MQLGTYWIRKLPDKIALWKPRTKECCIQGAPLKNQHRKDAN